MPEAIKSRILIIGAGAMGRLWGGYLQGVSETCFATRTAIPPHLHYTLIDNFGAQRSVDIPVWQHKDFAPDLILVTTKAPDAEAALASKEHLLSADRPVVLFQNGMGGQQAIAARYPSFPILAASTTEGAYIDADGTLVHAGQGKTWVGALNEAARNYVKPAVDCLRRSRLAIYADMDIEDRLWQKLAINAGINPFTALLDCPNGEILGQAFFEERIRAVCIEVCQLMNARGRSTSPEKLEAQVRDVAQRTASNSSSMRQDVRAGRLTEIEMMNGFVAHECEALGLPAPVNQALADAVKALR